MNNPTHAQAARQLATDRFIPDWVDLGHAQRAGEPTQQPVKDVANQYVQDRLSLIARSAAYYNQGRFSAHPEPRQGTAGF